MSQVFVRRTTAALLTLIAALAIVCVALLVLLLAPDWNSDQQEDGKSTTTGQKEKLEEIKTLPWEKHYRIPDVTYPKHYDLYLHPDIDNGKYTGHVKIMIEVTNRINYLVTHIKNLEITMTKLINMSKQNETVELNEFFEYKPNEFWVVRPRTTLRKGTYYLQLHFNGKLTGKIVGFYKSVYKTKTGEKRSIATSKFQPTDARQAFPCFDEPSFKSTFSITVVKPSEGYIALSNMPIMNENVNSPRSGLTETVFEKSVPMVSYLVCFIVCDFDSVHSLTNDKKKFTVYAAKDQINRAQYAHDVGVHILNYFENYFEVKYPLPKQDMIAIPDYVSGATEHWGLITYRESNLLYDDVSSSSANKQRVATIISHELAHMWFGNLVTLKWWDDLWLNEGFASYIEYKGVADYEKDWDMEAQFLPNDLHRVLKLDSQLTSHPIVQAVNHPDEITEIFDIISYSKGSSVLRMLENFMGEEDFRLGIRNFLRKFEFDNAVTKDLWVELAKTSSDRLDISGIMDTWTIQMGYPVITVKISQQNPNKLVISQDRFLSSPDAVSQDDSPFHYKWEVPITYFTDTTPKKLLWLHKDDHSLEITKPSDALWIKFNKGQYGYYRVNYDLPLWNDLIYILKTNHQVLDPSDRANLLNDAFALSSADLLDYQVLFDLTNYLSKEQHFIPWRIVTKMFSEYTHLLRKTKVFPYLRRYIVDMVKPHIKRLGWDDTGSHLERRNRIDLLTLACSNGDEECLLEAYKRFKSLIDEPTTVIPPNLRSLVYQYGIKKAGYNEWNILLERYQTELNAQEKIKMLSGLTSIEEDWIIYRLLDVAKNESIVKSQDYFISLIFTGRNPTATSIVWDYIKENWNYLVERFTLNNRYLGTTIKSVATEFTSEYELEDVKQFFRDQPEAGSGKRAREQAVEELATNIKWINKYEDTIFNWLLSRQNT